MEGDKHFSHDHPLISFFEENYEDVKDYSCHICGLPILSSPSYTCSFEACNFFLHKPCAEFPKKIRHPSHDPDPYEEHNLHLDPSGRKFTYKCRNCEFHIHPLELLPVEIKTVHKSHPLHPLVVVCRETLCRCDACAQQHTGFFFSCHHHCNFWVHQDCTLLPSFVKIPSSNHDFPFILMYCFNTHILPSTARTCFVCGGSLRLHRYDGIYFCGEIISAAHVSCVKSEMVALNTDTTRHEIIQLPDVGDTFPSVVIRRLAEGDPNILISQHHYNKEFHEHSLILDGGNNNNDNNISTGRQVPYDLVCDLCTQPVDISSPFFRCELQNCHFLAHIICANLSTKIKCLSQWGGWEEFNCIQSNLNPVNCYLCFRVSNGFHFRNAGSPAWRDLECAVAPRTMKHASHPQHVLVHLLYMGGPGSYNIQFSCCSDYRTLYFGIYRCVLCEFFIHKRCALLPKRTRHKFDDHPLELITAAATQPCFCEFCEQDIDRRYWYYGCRECEQYFHIDCIPSVGRLSKVNFGITLVEAGIHHHPIALTRMLMIGRHERCGHCRRRIEGFAEEIAFHCWECDFWIHYSCALPDAPHVEFPEDKLIYYFRRLAGAS